MVLSLFVTVLAVVVAALFFEFLPEHLGAFLELTLAGRATFTFVISSFFPGGLPAFESHVVKYFSSTLISYQMIISIVEI
jgi:hypothetical protein